jgi:hypothetical protein
VGKNIEKRRKNAAEGRRKNAFLSPESNFLQLLEMKAAGDHLRMTFAAHFLLHFWPTIISHHSDLRLPFSKINYLSNFFSANNLVRLHLASKKFFHKGHGTSQKNCFFGPKN